MNETEPMALARRDRMYLAAQHAIADAMLAFHQQLAAALRGDERGVRHARLRSERAIMKARTLARTLCGL